MTSDDRHVSVYRVGLFDALHRDRRAITILGRWPTATLRLLRRLAGHIRRREWRAVRTVFAGWLAEHEYAGTRCGHGWTPGRALADLRRHLDELESGRG